MNSSLTKLELMLLDSTGEFTVAEPGIYVVSGRLYSLWAGEVYQVANGQLYMQNKYVAGVVNNGAWFRLRHD